MGSNFMEHIDHVIVLMMENRSLDNLAGWLYEPDPGPQPTIIGRQDPPHYDGLAWGEHSNPSRGGKRVPVHRGVSNFCVPSPDPHEQFEHMNVQIFGTEKPKEGQRPTMGGFLRDYATVRHAAAEEIMQTYDPAGLNVLSTLARRYAISDAWHASNPTQTAPNRAFMHAGTSEGRVNNLPLPLYGAKTIFRVMHDAGCPWKVYRPNDQRFPMTRVQMLDLWDPRFDDNFGDVYGDTPGCFEHDAKHGDLPAYTFLEPAFIPWTSLEKATSEHPPSDVCSGEHYLSRIWEMIRKSKNWHKTLFIITFDEHGGNYDHVPPTWNATPPDDKVYHSLFHCLTFRFNRFGVRIPTLLISPWIAEHTVLRPDGEIPFDHTSILRTLCKWKQLDVQQMAHGRIDHAPTIERVFSDHARSEKPKEVKPTCTSCNPERHKGKHFLTILEKWVLCGHHLYHHSLHSAPEESRRLLEEVQQMGEHQRLHPELKRLLRRLTTEDEVRDYVSGLS